MCVEILVLYQKIHKIDISSINQTSLLQFAHMSLGITALNEKMQLWNGCALAETSNLVMGEGNPHASIMLIGEAPGQKEDEQTRPFVGASGKFLGELLASIGLKREDVYITNVVKYRPPDNRDPTSEEKAQCLPWLQQEIAIIQPKVIVPLGRHALGNFLPDTTITLAHGKPFLSAKNYVIFPIYHPAAALHNGKLRQSLYDDFKALGEYLKSQNLL